MKMNSYSHRSRGRGAPRRNGVGFRSQSVDSSGPGGKVRGTIHQVHEKYLALARDANSSGDRISAESFYQHAEHYYRLINAQNQSSGHHANAGHRGRNGSAKGPPVLKPEDNARPEAEVETEATPSSQS